MIEDKTVGVKVDLSKPDKCADVMDAMRQLMESKGWPYLKGWLESMKRVAEESMADCSLPNELLKNSGKLQMIRGMLAWPVVTAEQAFHAKSALEERAKKVEARPPHPNDPHRR